MARGRLASWLPSWLAGGVLSAAAVALAGACSSTAPPSLEETHIRTFTNGGFETGAAGATPPSWPVTPYLNNGITVQTPETLAGLDLVTMIAGHSAPKDLTTILVSATGPLTQPDADLGPAASLRWPRYGNQCALVNQHSSTNFTTGGTNNGQNVNSMAQTMTIGAGDIDPADNKVHVRFVVAPVLQNPAHAANQQPYYLVQLTDLTTSTLLYSDFNLSGAAGIPWKTVNGGTANEIDYTDWQLVDISPSGTSLAMGDMVELQIIASGCSLGGHYGEIYVDGTGTATVPGLFVVGTGPARVGACSPLTYTLTYENGAATAATGVSVTFNTPPQTTFASVNAPGLTCMVPTVGTAGAVVCTVGNLAAGAQGSFQVTVDVSCTATGLITAGNYSVQGTGITPLLGPHVNTTVGCSLDTQCAAGDWCEETIFTCTPTLPNGTAVPTDPAHTNPTINGTCTAAAGALVCTSAVCDTTDNKCGFANGDGACTVADGAVVCRSAACDPDGKCGYADGDGPCTALNGGIVCRSGACSTNLTCEPVGGCNVDADCTGGNWCDESTHTCTPKLGNGVPVPTDPPHTAPTLNGTCTAGAGALVCTSGVCDVTDNKCGYANGDGPCTGATGPTVCRSGMCSVNLTCEPAGGCDVDADCTGGDWCNEAAHTCTPPLANGTPVPTDPTHTGPTLNGTCTVAAGALVCASTVCDTNDNECGYANGDGPCTAADGPIDCRSGACSTNLTCEPSGGCNVDADCATGKWCNETMHQCVPQLANGTAVPTDTAHTSPTLNGTCTAAAGALVCVSGVCDVKDNKCGYANGDGPCTASDGTADCRSTICATSGTNANLCVACIDNTSCGGSTIICDTTSNTCVQCTTSSQCPSDAPTCDTTSGTCGTACTTDANCPAADWCDITTGAEGTCTPKIPNGKPLPTTPSSVATCSAAVAKRVCVSGVCDSANNTCGPASDAGVPDAGAGCKTDSECGTGKYCDNGACVPTLPLGDACDRNAECQDGQGGQAGNCTAGICSEVISSGAGVFCAIHAPGQSGGDADWTVIGAMLGFAGIGLGRRRRRAA